MEHGVLSKFVVWQSFCSVRDEGEVLETNKFLPHFVSVVVKRGHGIIFIQ